jgi:organic hydroperoxide reductase OsmC/OhrA
MSMETLFEITLNWPADANQAKPPQLDYSRNSTVTGINKLTIPASSPSGFGGDDARYNPEELMLMSLSQCHMLTFLAVAARAKVSVLAYVDRATGNLYKAPTGRIQFEKVLLQPRVTVPKGTDLAQLQILHEKAHANCFMANSVNFPVHCEAVGIEQ